jgi:UDP-galactopyranose mutase
VLASVDGQLLPIPINLDTINKLYGLNLTSFQVEEFFNPSPNQSSACGQAKMSSSGASGASFTKSFSAITRASSGA